MRQSRWRDFSDLSEFLTFMALSSSILSLPGQPGNAVWQRGGSKLHSASEVGPGAGGVSIAAVMRDGKRGAGPLTREVNCHIGDRTGQQAKAFCGLGRQLRQAARGGLAPDQPGLDGQPADGVGYPGGGTGLDERPGDPGARTGTGSGTTEP